VQAWSTIRFGFLPLNRGWETDEIRIKSITDAAEKIEQVLSSRWVDDEWHYKPYFKDSVRIENKHKEFFRPSPIIPPVSTHVISNKGGPVREDFLIFHIILLGFTFNMVLIPENWSHLNKVRIYPRKNSPFVAYDNNVIDFLKCGEILWNKHDDDGIALKLMNIIYWHINSQHYDQDFERFLFQYMILDACYRLSKDAEREDSINKKDETHYKRPGVLCKKLRIKEPKWIEIKKDACGRRCTDLSQIRNNLIHEIEWGGKAIGFGVQPQIRGITLELTGLVSRIICAMLGYVGEFSRSDCQNRFTFLFDGAYDPNIAI